MECIYYIMVILWWLNIFDDDSIGFCGDLADLIGFYGLTGFSGMLWKILMGFLVITGEFDQQKLRWEIPSGNVTVRYW
jgi:hypothetical protein